MATKPHKLLTGADLHEPKGVETALTGQVYVANGAGSGAWITINTTIQFSTGDIKATLKTTPDTDWIMMDEGTIGSATSGATSLASAAASGLFTLLWNNLSNGDAPVSGGRGGSAAADWAANKTIQLPRSKGRTLVGAGTGAGITAKTLGNYIGTEFHTLTIGEIPSHNHNNVLVDPGHQHTGFFPSGNNNVGTTGTPVVVSAFGGVLGTNSNTTGMSIVNASSGGGLGHNNMQPSLVVNYMIKL